jgi:hypothetical protein
VIFPCVCVVCVCVCGRGDFSREIYGSQSIMTHVLDSSQSKQCYFIGNIGNSSSKILIDSKMDYCVMRKISSHMKFII